MISYGWQNMQTHCPLMKRPWETLLSNVSHFPIRLHVQGHSFKHNFKTIKHWSCFRVRLFWVWTGKDKKNRFWKLRLKLAHSSDPIIACTWASNSEALGVLRIDSRYLRRAWSRAMGVMRVCVAKALMVAMLLRNLSSRPVRKHSSGTRHKIVVSSSLPITFFVILGTKSQLISLTNRADFSVVINSFVSKNLSFHQMCSSSLWSWRNNFFADASMFLKMVNNTRIKPILTQWKEKSTICKLLMKIVLLDTSQR